MLDPTVYADLKPAGLWRHFAAINRIPRPSGREGQMAKYVRDWAAKLGFPVEADAAGNLCVHAPGRAGRTAAPVVVLQGHLDMVCERNSDSPYDPELGNIHPVRDGEWVRSEGTTLGADNGIGVAAMLLAAESADLTRGPIDLLFTVDEETGLNGARNLDPAIVRGRVLLNLDSEDDGELCVGCAGSTDVKVVFRAGRDPAPAGGHALRLKVTGLQGGHSGVDINQPRLNANRALARLLQAVAERFDVQLVQVEGGNKRNAIPREASADFFSNGSAGAVRAVLDQEVKAIREQYAGAEDAMAVSLEPVAEADARVWSVSASRRLIGLIRGLPNGVLAMSPAIPELVETSNNVGVVRTLGDEVQIGCLVRTSLNAAAPDVVGVIRSVARLAGAEVEDTSGYPGWRPDMTSRALAVTKAAFRREFGHDPKVTAVHAGLECGIIGERVPGMDMVSFGPDIKGAHAPGERVHVGSVERFWQLLAAVLNDLSK